MGKKLDTLMLVTFKSDYTVGKSGKTLYKAGTHAMHANVAAKLEKRLGKDVTVKKYDKKEHLEKIKAANAKKDAKS